MKILWNKEHVPALLVGGGVANKIFPPGAPFSDHRSLHGNISKDQVGYSRLNATLINIK